MGADREDARPDWSEAQLSFTPEGSIADAGAVLGPLQPGRLGDQFRLHIMRSGGGVDRARNIFRRLDGRRIWGTLALVGVIGDVAPAVATPAHAPAQPFADAWDGALSQLPPDWSDLLCDLEQVRRDLGVEVDPVINLVARHDERVPGGGAALPHRESRVRRLAGHGAPVLRAHGRRGHHRLPQRSLRPLRHGERRNARPGLASGGTFRIGQTDWLPTAKSRSGQQIGRLDEKRTLGVGAVVVALFAMGCGRASAALAGSAPTATPSR